VPRGGIHDARRKTANAKPCDTFALMRVGWFNALLTQFPLEKVVEQLKALNIIRLIATVFEGVGA